MRLGHNAFTHRMLDDETISQRGARLPRISATAWTTINVTAYRAVATAAAREVRNYRRLMERIQRKSGIELEVISSEEEARLVCSAVHWALGDSIRPRLIFDLGGGSLELNFFQRGVLEQRVALPLGTIRLMETYSIEGAIDEDRREAAAASRAVAAAQRDAVAAESFARDRGGLRRKCRSAGAACARADRRANRRRSTCGCCAIRRGGCCGSMCRDACELSACGRIARK